MTPRRLVSPVTLGLVISVGGLAAPGETRAAPVVIQELLYDGSGADAPEAFTELFGEPGMTLDGWLLVGVNGGTGTAYRQVDLTGTLIPTDGVLVVATSSAEPGLAAVRDVVASVDWQNGPDAVQLLDPTGAIVDAIQYGDASTNNAGFGLPAPDTPAGSSLSRDILGTNTFNNLTDFTVGLPTPGIGPVLDTGEPPPDPGPSVPEPTTLALTGVAVLWAVSRRRVRPPVVTER